MPEPLPPGSIIGILGGGQLGRMLATAAARLGFQVHVFCEKPDAPAFAVAASHVCAPWDDVQAVQTFAGACDVITYEFENVPLAAVEAAAPVPVCPGVRALEVTQDRLTEKEFLTSLGIPTAPFVPVSSADDLAAAADTIGRPAILKTRRLGYDGKGQARLEDGTDPQSAFAAVDEAPSILEGFVRFDRELSIIAVRGHDGAIAYYDLTENLHENQILKESRVPAKAGSNVAREAQRIAERIAAALDYVGVLAVELFHCGPDAPYPLLVNEIAPRVHNSGHWTLDACAISQFENHIRAIAGWPLGTTERHGDAVMTNLIGDEVDRWAELASDPGVSLHLYGKAEARPGRKMGHFTRVSPGTA